VKPEQVKPKQVKQKPAGLVCSGGVTRSFVARMPGLLSSIGPLKATSYRVARRISNSLRAGRAVENYSDLRTCHALWIVAADPVLDQIAAHLPPGVPAVVCHTFRDSWHFGPRPVATLHAIPPDERLLVAEGDPEVIRYLRRVAAADRRKLIEIHPASKPLLLAGVSLATHIALPWIAAAVESLRAAGLSRAEATRVVEQLGERTLRSYAKAGAKAWTAAAESELRRALEVNLSDPRLGDLYRTGIECALEFFGN
jgi:hypothetical protein